MNKIDFLAEEVFKRYGTIKRARGPFLYTEKRVRLTDLYQEGGRAILGWGGGSAFTMLKNALDRGATGSYKTDFTHRLEKAVNELFIGDCRKVYVFSSKEDAVSAGLKFSMESTCVYHPWHQTEIDWNTVESIVIEPPLPWTPNVFLLAVKDTEENSSKLPEAIKRQIRLSSPMEAAVTRSMYNLISALQTRQEKDWFIYDNIINEYWERKGPYLFPKIPMDRYKDFVLHCLDLGIVISPVYENPSIVPFGADRGVFTVLKKNPFRSEN
ncbi:hypothetical protein [Treponema sp.]|uniref:hypothetical protein n=1 Tax=Treponema sp. TaxID=166 RepID=UPI00298E5789|nr:hypothetical protein [Treponema sp.]MCQ2242071.1 hypothetical protein [Treponema sp.]